MSSLDETSRMDHLSLESKARSICLLRTTTARGSLALATSMCMTISCMLSAAKTCSAIMATSLLRLAPRKSVVVFFSEVMKLPKTVKMPERRPNESRAVHMSERHAGEITQSPVA